MAENNRAARTLSRPLFDVRPILYRLPVLVKSHEQAGFLPRMDFILQPCQEGPVVGTTDRQPTAGIDPRFGHPVEYFSKRPHGPELVRRRGVWSADAVVLPLPVSRGHHGVPDLHEPDFRAKGGAVDVEIELER